MLQRFRQMLEWGIREDTPFSEAAQYRLTNLLLFCMMVGSVGITASCFATGAYQAGILNSTAPLVFGGGLLLMRAGWTMTARLLVLIIAYACGHVLATMLGRGAQVQLI